MIVAVLFALLANFSNVPVAYAQIIPPVVAKYAAEYDQDPYTALDIMYCESGFKNVPSPTNDIGPMQINLIHAQEASKMGLDLDNYEDNIQYGFYLMSQQGLKPWSSSENCWESHPVSGG